MAVAFQRGSTTGPDDLNITVRDPGGTLIDPFRLEYAIYDATTGVEVLIGSPVNSPVRVSLGQYYAEIVFAADANIGDWVIRWTIQETAADPVYQSVQEFNIVGDSTIVSFTGNSNLDALIYSLRILLRDNNPDRNYRFRPPASMKFVQGQTQVFGFIWEDEELLEYIYMAIDDFNTYPPVTDLIVDNLWGTERRWRTAILLRAAAFAMFAIALNWIADEFSIKSDELIRVRDKDDNEYSLTAKALFDLLYGDKIRAIQEPTIEETRKIIEEMRNDDLKEILRDKE